MPNPFLPPPRRSAMSILALDPATLCGFAFGDGGAIFEHGVWDLSRGPRHAGGRWHWLRGRILAAHAAWGPLKLVAFEESSMGSHAMPVVVFHNRLRGVIEEVACEIGADVLAVPIGTLKKFATGSGAAKKHQMVRALETQYQLKVTDENECDAIWVLRFAEAQQRRPRELERPKAAKKRVKAALKKTPRLF